MKYTIISVDDSRKDNVANIESKIMWERAYVPSVDARIPSELHSAKNKWNTINTPGPFKAGEFGVFYSVLNCLEYGAADDGILYFEDDAMPRSDFQRRIDWYLGELPSNADLFAVWSPTNQHHDYNFVREYNKLGEPQYGQKSSIEPIFDYGHKDLCKIWQGYGNVSMLFTKTGCKKTLDYIKREGFFSPIDCLICIGTHTNNINGYALKPSVEVMIDYDWDRPTTIHTSKWGYIEELIK